MPIDLRSDTITKPTPAMREAMARAEVGDDVFGDDPTVARLEARTAEILGMEAALFTPSGTMANQLALRAHTEPGDEILVDANAHIYYYESGAPAARAGVMCRCLPGVRGVFTVADVEAVLRPADQHFALTKLVCIENTTIEAAAVSGRWNAFARSLKYPARAACGSTSMARGCGTHRSPPAFRSATTRRTSTP